MADSNEIPKPNLTVCQEYQFIDINHYQQVSNIGLSSPKFSLENDADCELCDIDMDDYEERYEECQQNLKEDGKLNEDRTWNEDGKDNENIAHEDYYD